MQKNKSTRELVMNVVHHNSPMRSSSCQAPVMTETFFRHNHWLIHPASHLCQEMLCPNFTTESGGLKLASCYFTYLTQFIHYSSMTLHWAWGHEYVEARWVRDRREEEEDEVAKERLKNRDEDAALLSNSDSFTLTYWVITPLNHSVACVTRAHTNEHRYITYRPHLLHFITF